MIFSRHLISRQPTLATYPKRIEDLVVEKDFEAAIQLAGVLVEFFDKHGNDTERGSAHFLIANVLVAAERLREAESEFNVAIKLNPSHAGAYCERALVKRRQGRLEEALKDLETAVKLASHQEIDTLTLLSDLCRELGMHEDAKNWLALAIELDATPYLRFRDIQASIELQDFDFALRSCNDELELEESASIFALRGWANMCCGRYKESKVDFSTAVAFLNPGEGGITFFGFSWLLSTCPDDDIRNRSLAIEFGKRVVDLGSIAVWEVNRLCAAAYANNEDWEKAVRRQEIAAKNAPKDVAEHLLGTLAQFNKKVPIRDVRTAWGRVFPGNKL